MKDTGECAFWKEKSMILQAHLWLMETCRIVLLCGLIIFDSYSQQIFAESDTVLGLQAPAETTAGASPTCPALMFHQERQIGNLHI